MRTILALWLLAVAPAQAADYVAAAGSTLAFTVPFQGEAVEGKFARFSPQLRFDPAHPETTRFDVAIDLASVSTGNDDGDSLLKGADFFAITRMPQARFQAGKARVLGGGRYAADGTLTLRGISKPVTLSFRWTAGAKPVLEGEARLRRMDFGITAGEFGSEIGEAVQVRTRLVLVPAPAAKPASATAPVRKPAPAKP